MGNITNTNRTSKERDVRGVYSPINNNNIQKNLDDKVMTLKNLRSPVSTSKEENVKDKNTYHHKPLFNVSKNWQFCYSSNHNENNLHNTTLEADIGGNVGIREN